MKTKIYNEIRFNLGLFKTQLEGQATNEYCGGKCNAVRVAINRLEDFKEYSCSIYIEKLNDELSDFSSQSAHDLGFRMMMRLIIKTLMGCGYDN